MKEVKSEGNLPKALQVLAKEVRGHGRATIFYECETAREVENTAKDKMCEELSCVLDPKTSRGFLVGFGFGSGRIVTGRPDTFVQMKIYFVELSTSDFQRYSKMLSKHKQQQQEDMMRRKQLTKQAKK